MTFTPIILEAVVKAIKDFPMVNVSVDGDNIIKKRDINKLLELGGNIYYVFKIAAVLGHSMQSVGAMMSEEGMSEKEFQQMMINGGRSIEGNRSKKENNNG